MLASSVGVADEVIVFRWGGTGDDKDLLENARKSNETYELTDANIVSIINFQKERGWSKSSGDGVYFSDHPNAWFGDGRYELFIIELVSPEGVPFPISQGELGSKVRDYYANPSLNPPPMVSQYTPNAFVIARPPNRQEQQNGYHIRFWPATERDAARVWNQLSNGKLQSDSEKKALFDKFQKRLSEPEYSGKISRNTTEFIEALAKEAKKAVPNPEVTASIEKVLNSTSLILQPNCPNSLNRVSF